MLVDPYGNRLQASLSLEIVVGAVHDGTGEFEYLVEACDPCEADTYAYQILGIAVSDFITPHFYDPLTTPGTRYSFTGAIKGPRQLLPGGYISFVNTEADRVQQILWVDPSKPPTLKDLGAADARSLRQWVDGHTHSTVQKHRRPNAALAQFCHERRTKLEHFALTRASYYPLSHNP